MLKLQQYGLCRHAQLSENLACKLVEQSKMTRTDRFFSLATRRMGCWPDHHAQIYIAQGSAALWLLASKGKHSDREGSAE